MPVCTEDAGVVKIEGRYIQPGDRVRRGLFGRWHTVNAFIEKRTVASGKQQEWRVAYTIDDAKTYCHITIYHTTYYDIDTSEEDLTIRMLAS